MDQILTVNWMGKLKSQWTLIKITMDTINWMGREWINSALFDHIWAGCLTGGEDLEDSCARRGSNCWLDWMGTALGTENHQFLSFALQFVPCFVWIYTAKVCIYIIYRCTQYALMPALPYLKNRMHQIAAHAKAHTHTDAYITHNIYLLKVYTYTYISNFHVRPFEIVSSPADHRC